MRILSYTRHVNDRIFSNRCPNTEWVCVKIIQVLIDAAGDRITITSIMRLPSCPGAIQLAVKKEKDRI
jgi:hypothetical protein